MQSLPLGRGTTYPPNSDYKRDDEKFVRLLYERFINLKYLKNLKNIRNSKLREGKEFETLFDSQEQMENDMFWRGDLEDDISEIVEKKVFPEDDPRSRSRKTAFYNREKDLLSHYLEHFGGNRDDLTFTENIAEVGEKVKTETDEELKISEMLENGIDIDIVEEANMEDDVTIVKENKVTEKPVSFTELVEQKGLKEDKQKKEIKETKDLQMKEEKVEIKKDKEEKSEGFTVSFGNMFKKEKKESENKKSEDKKEKEELKEVKKVEEAPSELKEMKEEVAEMVEQEEMQVGKKITDETSVTYISKDKMFLITGTKKGFVNIWAFLEPYPSAKIKIVQDYMKEKRRMSLGGDKVTVESEDQESINEEEYMEEEMEFRRPEVLGWSEIYREPDYSFAAHDSEIRSIQITPKRFSKNQVDYIIVTTSKDKSVKVWKLINLIKVIKKSQKNKEEVNSDKIEGDEIKLEMMGWLGGEEYVDAVFIPNTSKEVIVTKEKGIIEKYEITNTNKVAKEWDKTNMKLKNQIEAEEKWTIGSISTSCDYYAVGGQTGMVNVYEVKNLNLIGSYLCRNRKGSNKKGGKVTGLEWNKKDNLILVTTLDSRIRMLSFTNVNKKILGLEVGINVKEKEESEVDEMKLEYVEKFKGHTNKKKQFKSRFIGVNEQLIMCPSENGQIVFWQITNDPSRRDEEEDDEICKEEMEEEVAVKNVNTISIKIENKELLERMNVFNKSEWDKLVEVLIKSKEKETYEPEIGGGCLGCKKASKSQNIDPINNLLIVSSEDGWQLKYTMIDTRYFE